MANRSLFRGLTAIGVLTVLSGLPLSAFAGQTSAAAKTNTGETISLKSTRTGDQTFIQNLDGAHDFAGNEVAFSGFSGAFGMASDMAYILVAKGTASIGSQKAKPGEVLILPPYGRRGSKQRYDAKRFIQAWSEEAIDANRDVYARFQRVAKKQRMAMFFGRYESTSFNVAAPGSSSQELARRSVVGADVVTEIRFSGAREPSDIERTVVDKFTSALVAEDAQTVASLMDPTPFGGADLRGGADGARLLTAHQLISSQNWSQRFGDVAPTRVSENGNWQFVNGKTRTLLSLRPVGDFVFIQSINTGA